MNGETDNAPLKQRKTPREIQTELNRRERTRLLFSLIISNLFVALTCYSLSKGLAEAPPLDQNVISVLAGHSLVILPIKSFVPDSSETMEVSLFNQEGQLIIEKALLHPEQERSSFVLDDLSRQIQIPTDQLERLIPHQNEQLMAHPYTSKNHQLAQGQPTRRNYELRF